MTEVQEREYTVFFAFAGIGGGAIGFQQASATLAKHGLKGRFKVIGAFDFDPGAAADFERLTGVPCEVVDVRKLTVKRLRALCPRRPDVVFGSAPCKGASPLLGNELAETEKYQEMNELMLVWTELMLAAWGDDPPLLVINENVPRLASRAKDTVKEVVKLHQKHGYVVHAGSHDCGEVGGLAQHRVRFLLVARLARKVTSFLYQPPKQRVRGCGEVIGPLPLPSDPAGGDMHILTDICVTNWIRLALIPPGGDWRDIEGALAAHEARHAHWSRYHTARFDLATPVVAGSGSNGAFGVGDARVSPRAATGFVACTIPGLADDRPLDVRLPVDAFPLMYGVRGMAQSSVTITGKASPSCGAFTLADERVAAEVRRVTHDPDAHRNKYTVACAGEPVGTLIGAVYVGSGAPSIEDLRVPAGTYRGAYGVLHLGDASGAITSAEGPSMGRFAVADERVASAVRAHAYHFTNELMLAAWWRPSRTVTGATHLGNGAGAVADVRVPGNRYGMNWRVDSAGAPAHTVIGVTDIQAGAPSYPDVRVPPSTFLSYGVLAFTMSAGAITGNRAPGGGSFSVVDVRLTCEVRENSGAYGVLKPTLPAYTITAWGDINNGRFAFADTRDLGVIEGRRDVAVILAGMLAPEAPDFTADVEARVELTTAPATEAPKKRGRRRVRRVAAPCGRVRRRGGRAALVEGVALVADPRVPRNPSLAVRFWATRLDQPPIFVPVLATPSGYWHRPLTVWERFALQGFPLYGKDGRAIVLSGANISDWSERIGNAVPPPTARAVAEQMLLTLLHAEAGVFVLSSAGGAWVQPGRAPRWMRVLGVEDLIPRKKRASRKVVAQCGSFAAIEPGDPWATFVAAGTAPSTEVLQ